MLEILKYPDPRLEQQSEPVKIFDSELHAFLNELAVTMYGANGVGLAAPQVGRFIRAFVVDIVHADNPRRELHEFINPKLLHAEGKISFEEGCLSVPGFAEEVQRKEKVQVEFQDRIGNVKKVEAHGLLAVAIQHETDHLDGVLFIDRLSPLKRKFVKRKLKKVVAL